MSPKQKPDRRSSGQMYIRSKSKVSELRAKPLINKKSPKSVRQNPNNCELSSGKRRNQSRDNGLDNLQDFQPALSEENIIVV